jgi:hypothetical protein
VLQRLFVEKAKEVVRLADAWSKHQISTRLEGLVDGIQRLKCIGDVEALLNAVPNTSMDPSSRLNLYNMINKVARYREVARFLYRLSQWCELVRRMSLTIVHLPQEVYHRPSLGTYSPRLATTLTRFRVAKRKPNLAHICRSMETTETQADQPFVKQTIKTTLESKIHAEVQLLYYCELHRCNPPPRFIASSKYACFFCNTLMRMHGKMFIGRTHGRQYPGWRLPQSSELQDLPRGFNAALEVQIQESLATLLVRGRKTFYPEPNESDLLTLVLSTSTLHSNAAPREEAATAVCAREALVQSDCPARSCATISRTSSLATPKAAPHTGITACLHRSDERPELQSPEQFACESLATHQHIAKTQLLPGITTSSQAATNPTTSL